MKLGKDTGSVANYLMSGTKGQPAPEVGMGVTLLHWTDRSAGTITRVSPSGKTFWFREDIATRTDRNGLSESQEYTFATGDGPESEARLSRKGEWKSEGTRIRVGSRDAYVDPSF